MNLPSGAAVTGTSDISQTPTQISMPSEEFLRTLSWLFGWIYFSCWAIASYPQPLVNFRRKSVTGLSLDAFTINVLGHSCYTVSCLVFLYSGTVRRQYRRRWGEKLGEPTVRGNDLATAAHALFWSLFTITQFYCWGYTRLPSQKLSRGMRYLILACLAAIAGGTLLVLIEPAAGSEEDAVPVGVMEKEGSMPGTWEWLDVIYLVGHIKLLISVIKYYPQVYLNYLNKSTRGWAIHKCVLDFIGSLFSLCQLSIDASLTPDGLRSVVGNPVKLWLGCISVGFEAVFMLQHWVLYPAKKQIAREGYDIERRGTSTGQEREGEERRELLPAPEAGGLRGRGGAGQGEYGTVNDALRYNPVEESRFLISPPPESDKFALSTVEVDIDIDAD